MRSGAAVWGVERIGRPQARAVGCEELRGAYVRADDDAVCERTEELEVVDDAAADGEFHLIGGERAHGFEQILDALSLVDAADKEEPQFTAVGRATRGIGGEAGAVDAVGNDVHGLGRRAVLDEGGSGEGGGGEKGARHSGLAHQMLEVRFGQRELPLLTERGGAVRMSGELVPKDAPHAGGMGVQLKEHAAAAREGVKAVVAVAEQTGVAAIGQATGGLPEGGVGVPHHPPAGWQRDVAQLLEQEGERAGDGAEVDRGGRQTRLAALPQHDLQAGGQMAREALSPGAIGRPEEIGDERFEQTCFGKREGDLVGIARATLNHHQARLRDRGGGGVGDGSGLGEQGRGHG